jgi:hypothetical protein
MKIVGKVYFPWIGRELAFYRYEEGMKVYIRYGHWDNRNLSLNHGTGEKENGVSVYRAVVKNGVVCPDDDISREQLHGQGRFVFAVTGDEVGIGSDGEPVLRRVKPVDLPLSMECKV